MQHDNFCGDKHWNACHCVSFVGVERVINVRDDASMLSDKLVMRLTTILICVLLKFDSICGNASVIRHVVVQVEAKPKDEGNHLCNLNNRMRQSVVEMKMLGQWLQWQSNKGSMT